MKDMYHHVAGRKCEVRVPKRLEHERKLFVGRLPRGYVENKKKPVLKVFVGRLPEGYVLRELRGICLSRQMTFYRPIVSTFLSIAQFSFLILFMT